jgi:hypothetical protein
MNPLRVTAFTRHFFEFDSESEKMADSRIQLEEDKPDWLLPFFFVQVEMSRHNHSTHDYQVKKHTRVKSNGSSGSRESRSTRVKPYLDCALLVLEDSELKDTTIQIRKAGVTLNDISKLQVTGQNYRRRLPVQLRKNKAKGTQPKHLKKICVKTSR